MCVVHFVHTVSNASKTSRSGNILFRSWSTQSHARSQVSTTADTDSVNNNRCTRGSHRASQPTLHFITCARGIWNSLRVYHSFNSFVQRRKKRISTSSTANLNCCTLFYLEILNKPNISQYFLWTFCFVSRIRLALHSCHSLLIRSANISFKV